MPDYTLTVESLGDLPYLHLASVDAPPDAPFVLVLHGLGSAKEKILPTVYAYAREGFRVLALDARLHGERTDAGLRDARLADAYVQTLYQLITGTVQDVSRLLDHFAVHRAAVHGISLGGYITFAALLSEPRLAVASVAMGSPDWLGPLRAMGVDLRQPALAPIVRGNPLDNAADAYPPRPLLMLHGDADDTVPVDGVIALEARLRPVYAAHPERVELTLYPGLGHQYTEDMMQRSVAWTRRFL